MHTVTDSDTATHATSPYPGPVENSIFAILCVLLVATYGVYTH